MPVPSVATFIYNDRQFPILNLNGVEAISHPFRFMITVANGLDFDTRAMRNIRATLQL